MKKTLGWARANHLALEGALVAFLISVGLGLELGSGWGLAALGGLLLADLVADQVGSRR